MTNNSTKHRMSTDTLTFEDYKLRTQIFIGSVSEVIGMKKTMELMKEANEVILKLNEYRNTNL